MPIENLENPIEGGQLPVKKQNVFEPSSTVIAGFLVKHPLYDCKLLLIGFSIYCPYDQEKARVTGMTYWIPDTRLNIFPKVIIDMKQHEPHNFSDLSYLVKADYYLYKNIADNSAQDCSDEIYAVCKYIKDGITKHAFFNVHEITPDI